jgi:hypothetical protein
MIIEYYATDEQDAVLERWLKGYKILEWFNPEDDYYVLETEEEAVITVLGIVGIEFYMSDQKNSRICRDL